MVQYLHSFFGFKHLTPAQKIAASFLLVILLGTVLLMLPISHRDHQMYSLIDALFTATSATCVTGLVVNVTVQEFTIFGQAVILLLIQIGGLGLMTLMAVFILLLKSRLSMHEKMAMKEMLNQDQVFNMHRFLMDILKYTLLFEGCGMVVLALRFIPDFGIMRGLFKALFVSVSAFCNAGFDNLGAVSLIDYVHDPLVIIPVMALIVLGGLGFAVWFDLRDKIKLWLKREISLEKFRKSLLFQCSSPYFTSYSVCFSFSKILRVSLFSTSYSMHFSFSCFSMFLAKFHFLQCVFLFFHHFQFSYHIPDPTLCISNFPRF